jgi:hypothetical protein
MWVKNFTVEKGVYARTRSYYAWKSLKRRCVEYSSVNNFKDFQHFAESMRSLDFLYERESNGKLWQVDKDFNLNGDRSYCEDNIILLPNEINPFITNMDVDRELPLGVIFIDRTKGGKFKGLTKAYRANCKDRVVFGGTKYLQYYDNPLDAHLSWVEEKKALLCSKMKQES